MAEPEPEPEPEPQRDPELERKLIEVGNKMLVDLPSDVEDVLRLLDEVESCLSRVDQHPREPMLTCVAPSQKALIDERLFKHTDADVKVAVALCITEITRITAPEAPYGDDQMRDVFQLVVSCFRDLADNTSRSFNKRTMILDTVARVHSCAVMLDLECDALIIEMFQLFFNSIRGHHHESVFSSMEEIMSHVIKESEEISVELLSPLLASVRKDNEEVIPTARKLGEVVIANCAAILKPYITAALKSSKTSAVDYSDVVASICAEVPKTVEQNPGHTADENKIGAPSEDMPEAVKETVVYASTEKPVEPANEDTPVTAISNEVSQTREDKSVDSNPSKKNGDEDEDGTEQATEDDTMKNKSQNLDVEAAVAQEIASKRKEKKFANSKKPTEPIGSSAVDTEKGKQLPDIKTGVPDLSVPAEAAPPAETKEAVAESSMEKDMEKESETIVSPSVSENVPEETLSKKGGQSKKKESSTKDLSASRHGAPEKASEEDSDSEGKPLKHYGKKGSRLTIGEDMISSHKATPKNRRGSSSKSEEKQIKRSAKKVEPGSASGDKSSSKAVLKLMKDVQPAKETPEAALKGKHTPASSIRYGQEVVGERVKVWWPRDRQFYEGRIDAFDSKKRMHMVLYDDGEVEVLNLKRQRFEFIQSEAETDKEDEPVPDDSDMDAASDTPLKKKVRTNRDQSKKQVKMGATPKWSDGASSSKSKGASSKSGQKVKECGKTDRKVLAGMKSGKTADDAGLKGKDHKLKSGSKSAAISSQSSGDLKDDDKLAENSKSKEVVKSSVSEQDMPPRSTKIRIKVKQQIGSSKDKAKEDEDEEKNTADSFEVEETPKLKVASSSKVRGDEAKSNKRRRKA